MKEPLIIGHRGAAGLAPENTLAAIEKALEIGVDRIEIDLRQTIDGRVVVLHDKTINRTTNGRGRVKDMTLKRLHRYSAGIKFSKAFSDEKVPTFEEVLELVNGRTTLLLEIKHGSPYHPSIENNIIRLIHEYGAADWCIIQSFNDKVLRNFMSSPELESDIQKLVVAFIPVAPFYTGSRFSYKQLKRYDYAEEVNINYRYVNQRVVRKVHAMGKKINVWTVNEPRNLRRFVRWGVDGIITDRPDLLRQILMGNDEEEE